MRTAATDVPVAWASKTAEWIEVLFDMEMWWGILLDVGPYPV